MRIFSTNGLAALALLGLASFSSRNFCEGRRIDLELKSSQDEHERNLRGELVELEGGVEENYEDNILIASRGAEHERRLSWWGALFFAKACLPGPKGENCRLHSSSNEGDDTSDADTGTDAASASAQDDGSSQNHNADVGQGSRVSALTSPSSASFWLMIIAACAVATAIAAMVIGSRKVEPKPFHPLHGSVGNRMKLFSGFADRAFCGGLERPEREVEISQSHVGADYQLA